MEKAKNEQGLHKALLHEAIFLRLAIRRMTTRLRVVSNFGDGDYRAAEIHTRARAKFRGDATRRERRKLETTDKAREFDL